VFPAFYGVTRGHQRARDYRAEYDAGHLSLTARRLMDALVREHPQYTRGLRANTFMLDPGKTREFERAMAELQQGLWIVKTEERYEPTFSYRWDLLEAWLPDAVAEGRRLGRARAIERLIERFVGGAVFTNRTRPGAAVPVAGGRGHQRPRASRASRHARPPTRRSMAGPALARSRLGAAKMRLRGRRRLAIALLVVVVAAGALVGVAIRQGSPASLVARKGHLAAVEVAPGGEDAISTMSQLTLRRSTGRDVSALVRVPRGPGPIPRPLLPRWREPGAACCGVRGLDAIARHAVIVSPDYPLPARRGGWTAGAPSRCPSSCARGVRHVADILLLLDYLDSRPDVAKTRLFLVGSSLGAPAVAIAAASTRVQPRSSRSMEAGKIGALVKPRADPSRSAVASSAVRAWLLGHALALGSRRWRPSGTWPGSRRAIPNGQRCRRLPGCRGRASLRSTKRPRRRRS